MESLDVSISSITSVAFVDIQDQYDCNEDLICRYDWDGFHPSEGDRIAVYKTGWLFVKDYFLFEWAPNYLETGTKFVIFNKLCLPKDDKEFYQFCYVSAENQVLGASKTFQFTDKISNYLNVSSDENLQMFSTKTDSKSSLKELQKLREENEILKESLKLFMAQKRSQNREHEINTLKTMVHSLKDIAGKHRNEIEFLKSQMQLCLRRNKKLTEENVEIEQKYNQLLNSDNSSTLNSVANKFKNIVLELETIPPMPALDETFIQY